MSALSELSTLRKQKGGGRNLSDKADGRYSWFFLGPWYLGLILITAGPLLASLYLSFTDYDLLTDPEFIGIENYTQMFADPRLIKSLQVTAIYVFVSVPLQLAAALGLALQIGRAHV